MKFSVIKREFLHIGFKLRLKKTPIHSGQYLYVGIPKKHKFVFVFINDDIEGFVFKLQFPFFRMCASRLLNVWHPSWQKGDTVC